jgi:uncharacterized protein YndB with AHSA1/START domain
MHNAHDVGEPSLQLTHIYRASREVLFQSWTDPGVLSQWMCPPGLVVTAVDLDVRVGGRFHIVMRAGDTDVVHTGEYQELRPPDRLSFTWRSPNTHQQLTLIIVELYDEGGTTRLVLTQRRLPETAIQAHYAGWTAILKHLSDYLESMRSSTTPADP